jgi:hypothetical protein
MVVVLWDRARLAEDSGVQDTGGWGGVTLAHNVRSPAEVDAIAKEARCAGSQIVREPAETFWGGYSAAIVDPEATPGRSPTTCAGRSETTARSSSRPDYSAGVNSITGICRWEARFRYCVQPG